MSLGRRLDSKVKGDYRHAFVGARRFVDFLAATDRLARPEPAVSTSPEPALPFTRHGRQAKGQARVDMSEPSKALQLLMDIRGECFAIRGGNDMTLLDKLEAASVQVELDGENLRVRARELSEEQREFLRRHKEAIKAELAARQHPLSAKVKARLQTVVDKLTADSVRWYRNDADILEQLSNDALEFAVLEYLSNPVCGPPLFRHDRPFPTRWRHSSAAYQWQQRDGKLSLRFSCVTA